MALPYQGKKPFKKVREHKLNEEITHREVRITGEGIESKVVSIYEALKISKETGVDLVEINGDIIPPICKIIDYGKFLYDKKMKEKIRDRNQQQSVLKELRLTPTTDEHDLNFKTKHAINWLKNGDKVKAVVVFKGRQKTYSSQGELLLMKLIIALEEFGKPEHLPKMEGFKMIILFSPIKK